MMPPVRESERISNRKGLLIPGAVHSRSTVGKTRKISELDSRMPKCIKKSRANNLPIRIDVGVRETDALKKTQKSRIAPHKIELPVKPASEFSHKMRAEQPG